MSNYDRHDESASGNASVNLAYAKNPYILAWWTQQHDELLVSQIGNSSAARQWTISDRITAMTSTETIAHWRAQDPICAEYAWYNILMNFAMARAEQLGLTEPSGQRTEDHDEDLRWAEADFNKAIQNAVDNAAVRVQDATFRAHKRLSELELQAERLAAGSSEEFEITTTLADWLGGFGEQILSRLHHEGGSANFAVISCGDDYFVQFTSPGYPDLYMEAVSNTYLPEGSALSTLQIEALHQLGFGIDPEGGNFVLEYGESPDDRLPFFPDVASAAQLAGKVLQDVFQIAAPNSILKIDVNLGSIYSVYVIELDRAGLHADIPCAGIECVFVGQTHLPPFVQFVTRKRAGGAVPSEVQLHGTRLRMDLVEEPSQFFSPEESAAEATRLADRLRGFGFHVIGT